MKSASSPSIPCCLASSTFLGICKDTEPSLSVVIIKVSEDVLELMEFFSTTAPVMSKGTQYTWFPPFTTSSSAAHADTPWATSPVISTTALSLICCGPY